MPAKKQTGKLSSTTKRASSDTVRRNKKRTETYSSYIYRVLKQVHPETGISKKAMSIMNEFINDSF